MRNTLLFSFLMINMMIFILSSNSYSAQWCFVGSSKDYYYFVDSQSVRVRDSDITFWLSVQDIQTGKVISLKRYIINCGQEAVAIRDIILFNSEGTVTEEISYGKNLKWSEIGPKSKIHVIEQILCEDDEPRKKIKEFLREPFTNKEK